MSNWKSPQGQDFLNFRSNLTDSRSNKKINKYKKSKEYNSRGKDPSIDLENEGLEYFTNEVGSKNDREEITVDDHGTKAAKVISPINQNPKEIIQVQEEDSEYVY